MSLVIWHSNKALLNSGANSKNISRRCLSLNSLPNAEILPQSKFKTFANDKINLTEKSKFVLQRVENIAVKGENAGYQHFLLFPQCF